MSDAQAVAIIQTVLYFLQEERIKQSNSPGYVLARYRDHLANAKDASAT